MATPRTIDPFALSLPEIHRSWRKDLETRVRAVGEYDFSGLDLEALVGHASWLRDQLLETDPMTLQGEGLALLGEVAARVLGQRPYPVQHLGAMVVCDGRITEMATGEGKTLAAALAAAWAALCGQSVHVMTANEYLARRDAEWMGQVYSAVGLSVGVIGSELTVDKKGAVYACDIVYGTAAQFGFDYLIDHIVPDPGLLTGARREVAIVDEADSLLLDDARTPLVLSGEAQDTADRERFARWAETLSEFDYEADLETKEIWLTEVGIESAEHAGGVSNLYEHPHLAAEVQAALRAQVIFKRDRDYIVVSGDEGPEIALVDEGTGRIQEGRRYQDGLHEAIEAKEGLEVRGEAAVVASITIPSYLRLYGLVGGMTGTAVSAADELAHTYNLDVLVIPTHRPRLRVDEDDALFLGSADKMAALIEEISEAHETGQPILVGTPSVSESLEVAGGLRAAGIDCVVLNATEHEKEAGLIAQAGRLGAVTVATNMAGRGVDILLGGDPSKMASEPGEDPFAVAAAEREAVLAAGGLYVVGTARHSSRRIDDQLRGRAGRQGEPGRSKFFLSFDDELLLFAGDRVRSMVANVTERIDGPLAGRRINSVVDDVQKRLEALQAESRKNLFRMDEVVDAQRNEIYRYRDLILTRSWRENVSAWVALADERGIALDWRWVWPGLDALGDLDDGVEVPNGPTYSTDLDMLIGLNLDGILERAEEGLGDAALDVAIRGVLVSYLDLGWQEHLRDLEALREGIGLRGQGSTAGSSYSKDALELFEGMLTRTIAVAQSILWGGTFTSEPPVDEGEPDDGSTVESDADENHADENHADENHADENHAAAVAPESNPGSGDEADGQPLDDGTAAGSPA